MMKRLLCGLLSVLLISSSALVAGAIEDTNVQNGDNETPEIVETIPQATEINKIANVKSGVVLNWKINSNATGYYIYRKTKATSYKKLATVKNQLTNSYIDKKVKAKVKYAYYIKAFNNIGDSAQSKAKSIVRVKTPTVKTTNNASSIKVSWTKIKGATKYKVLWKSSSTKKYKKLYCGKKNYATASNINSGKKYMFKVKAVNGSYSGGYSAVKTQLFLQRPSLHAEEYTDMQGITLQWRGVKNAKGYRIYRSIKGKNSYKKIKTIVNSTTNKITYEDCTLSKNQIQSFSYYIVAYNGSYKSAKSKVSSDVYGYYAGPDVPLNLTIKKGEVYKDINKKLKLYGAETFAAWNNQNPSIAKITKDSIIKGLKKGKCTIIASGYYNGKIRFVTLIVTVK